MVGECKVFHFQLASLISIKHGIDKSKLKSWVRAKINFTLRKSLEVCLLGLRGSART